MNRIRTHRWRNQATYDRFESFVDVPMMVLAIVWLLDFVIQFFADAKLTEMQRETLLIADYVLWALFVVEYLIKLTLHPNAWVFFKTHIIDLILIVVPVFRPLRALRILRFGRVGLLLFRVVERVRKVLTKRGLHFVMLGVILVLVIGAVIVWSYEKRAPHSNIHSFGEAIWWAVTTVTTVGYGDYTPVTAQGRGIAVVLMLVGIGMVGLLTANVASYFVEQDSVDLSSEVTTLQRRQERIEAMIVELAGGLGVSLPSAPDPEEESKEDEELAATAHIRRKKKRKRSVADLNDAFDGALTSVDEFAKTVPLPNDEREADHDGAQVATASSGRDLS